MSSLLLISILMTVFVYSAAGQMPCSTPNGRKGRCTSIFGCRNIMKVSSYSAIDGSDKYTSCGMNTDTNTLEICCPFDECTTPDGAQGICINPMSCPQIKKMLDEITVTTIQQVRKYICNNSEGLTVCCAPETQIPSSTSEVEEPKCQLTHLPPDPNGACCGFHAAPRTNIVGGHRTEIDEYPWLALIEYRISGTNTIDTKCGGVLISGQYVLTAGHCIDGRIIDELIPTSVRLGEYNTSNCQPDCVPVAGGGEDCNRGAVSVAIDVIIPYPNYNPGNGSRMHDIALIRLAWIVQYTDFIRPICLPTTDFTISSTWKEKVYLYAAGWGKTETSPTSEIKMKVRLPYVPNQICRAKYRNDEYIQDGQICAGGENDKDTCVGDSGGPLMRTINGRHVLVGTVSFGHNPCGKEGFPGVYTKVFKYLPWIKRSIKN